MPIEREFVNRPSLFPGRIDTPVATILLVENHASIRHLITRFLALQNFTIVAAEDTRSARAIWATHKNEIDLILADVGVPSGLNGRRLAKEFQAERPELKVLYASECNAEALIANGALDAGGHFIQKPYQPEQLVSTIRTVLAGRFNLHAETLC